MPTCIHAWSSLRIFQRPTQTSGLPLSTAHPMHLPRSCTSLTIPSSCIRCPSKCTRPFVHNRLHHKRNFLAHPFLPLLHSQKPATHKAVQPLALSNTLCATRTLVRCCLSFAVSLAKTGSNWLFRLSFSRKRRLVYSGRNLRRNEIVSSTQPWLGC